MHKNYRRKNPRPSYNHYWRKLRVCKRDEMRPRVRSRRRINKKILRQTIINEDAWDEIRKFEKPVDWRNID